MNSAVRLKRPGCTANLHKQNDRSVLQQRKAPVEGEEGFSAMTGPQPQKQIAAFPPHTRIPRTSDWPIYWDADEWRRIAAARTSDGVTP
jgi:hypothetical protein